jgi:ribosomal protein L37AE/L43A
MLEYQRTLGEWGCLHNNFITKCSECKLIYCGKCYNPQIKIKFSDHTRYISCCPKCSGTDVHRISFGNQKNGRHDIKHTGTSL